MNSSRQMTYTQPLTDIMGPRNNWQWNKRGPVLGKNGIYPLKNPLKMDFKGVRHQKIICWPHHQFSPSIDAIWLLFDPKIVISKGTTWNKWFMFLFEFQLTLGKLFLGSKSCQNASIFHKKNDGGIKKYFFDVTPPDIQFLRFLRAI